MIELSAGKAHTKYKIYMMTEVKTPAEKANAKARAEVVHVEVDIARIRQTFAAACTTARVGGARAAWRPEDRVLR